MLVSARFRLLPSECPFAPMSWVRGFQGEEKSPQFAILILPHDESLFFPRAHIHTAGFVLHLPRRTSAGGENLSLFWTVVIPIAWTYAPSASSGKLAAYSLKVVSCSGDSWILRA